MVWFETVWLMVVLATLKDWHITGLDVKTAFLYGELNEELYMEQPKGFKVKGQECYSFWPFLPSFPPHNHKTPD